VVTGQARFLDYAIRMNKNLLFSLGLFLASITSAQAQERQWTLDATDQEAFLVFGVPETDDVGLSFWCKIGSKKMSAYLPANVAKLRVGEKTTMKITADGKSYNLPAKAALDGNKSKFTVEGQFNVNDKLMTTLQEADDVAITIKNFKASYPLTDADFPGLLSACNGDFGEN
jgi:hypothetical protein